MPCDPSEGKDRGRWTRRELLAAGAAGLAGALAAPPARAVVPRAKSCILIVCTGGPSQLDTWDPKPEAPAEIRGPYRARPTPVSGIRISETLPLLARRAGRYALLRSLHAPGPALHERGLQLLLTGDCSPDGKERLDLGALVARSRGGAAGVVRLPLPLDPPGIRLHPGLLESGADEAVRGAAAALRSGREERTAERYGRTPFGEALLAARRLVERGHPWITVHQYVGLFHRHTWDCHGFPDLPTRVADLEAEVARPFDRAVAALLDDLHDRGLLAETLVICAGEFGRAPRISSTGGREHHAGCWSVMLAGGGIRGGQVVGASDAQGSAPVERPVTPAMLAATLLHALGAAPGTHLGPDVEPVWELFA